jgi:hypothetical protein
MVETLLFLGEKLIDLFDQFQELLGVLLDRSLFAQPEPAFFSFALHGRKYYPMGTIRTKRDKSSIPNNKRRRVAHSSLVLA